MTLEERKTINELIDKMIGSNEHQRNLVAHLELVERINETNRYKKMREKLFKIAEKEGVEALCSVLIGTGRYCNGVTKSGKRFVFEGNHGMTIRSRYCGSLWIEGVGTVFTSGTIDKVLTYVLHN